MQQESLFNIEVPQDLPDGFIVTQVDGKPIRPVLISDITARKHGGNEQSVAANPSSVFKDKMHGIILEELARGDGTGKELAHRLGMEFNAISGRFSEMKLEAHRLMWIRETGERRSKGAVLTLTARGRDELERRSAATSDPREHKTTASGCIIEMDNSQDWGWPD